MLPSKVIAFFIGMVAALVIFATLILCVDRHVRSLWGKPVRSTLKRLLIALRLRKPDPVLSHEQLQALQTQQDIANSWSARARIEPKTPRTDGK